MPYPTKMVDFLNSEIWGTAETELLAKVVFGIPFMFTRVYYSPNPIEVLDDFLKICVLNTNDNEDITPENAIKSFRENTAFALLFKALDAIDFKSFGNYETLLAAYYFHHYKKTDLIKCGMIEEIMECFKSFQDAETDPQIINLLRALDPDKICYFALKKYIDEFEVISLVSDD